MGIKEFFYLCWGKYIHGDKKLDDGYIKGMIE